jgi:hypothetical protein
VAAGAAAGTATTVGRSQAAKLAAATSAAIMSERFMVSPLEVDKVPREVLRDRHETGLPGQARRAACRHMLGACRANFSSVANIAEGIMVAE